MASLVKELDIWLGFVSHLSTPDGTPHEEGGRVMLRHFKGSRAIGYWAHVAIGLERDQQPDEDDEDAEDWTTYRILKCRAVGSATGMTFPIHFNEKTGLLSEGRPFDNDDNPF